MEKPTATKSLYGGRKTDIVIVDPPRKGCHIMKNPWEEINLSDYENHVKLDIVMQIQAINKMMNEQFYQYPVKTINQN